jgi:O-antigen ligase
VAGVVGWALAAFLVVFALAFDVRAVWAGGSTGLLLPGKLAVLIAAALLSIVGLLWPARVPAGPTRGAAAGEAQAARWARRWWAATLVSFVLAAPLASEMPADLAWWGLAIRRDGAFLWVASLLLFAVAARWSAIDARVARWTVGGYLTGAVVVGALALLESVGVPIWGWTGLPGLVVAQPRATLGSHALVSAFTATAAVVAAALALTAGWRPQRQAVLGLVAVALAWTAVVAGGRSAVIGLAVVALAAVVWGVVEAVRGRRVWWALAFVAVAGLVGVVGTQATEFAAERYARLWSVLVGQGGDRAWSERQVLWAIAGDAIAAQPLRPYGPSAFAIVVWEVADAEQTAALLDERFPGTEPDAIERQGIRFRIVDPTTGGQSIESVWLDKAHNYLLDLWLAFGLVPTALLVAGIGWVFLRLVRHRNALTLGVAAAMAVYAVYAQAWFPAHAIEPLLFTLLGVGVGAATRVRQSATVAGAGATGAPAPPAAPGGSR